MQRHGFTLIELLVVICIILLLLGMLFPALNMVRESTNKTVTLQRIAQISTACETYHLQTRRYPDEQGVAWAASTPSWINGFPAEHRECVSARRSATVAGLADLLESVADLRVPGEALAKGGAINGYIHLVDGWSQPLRYQRIDELANGALKGRADFWAARLPPPQLAGQPGKREGFVLYATGGRLLTQPRDPTDPASDTALKPGQWWVDPKKLLYRSDSR